MRTIRLTRGAIRGLRALPKHQAELVRRRIDQYAADPASMANNVKRLQGRPGYRLRVGDYRIIFTDDGVVLEILAAGHRREVYK